MTIWIHNGKIITPDQTIEDSVLVLEDSRISAIEPARQLSENPTGITQVDARGLVVAPGLIDLHVHGGAGSDTMDATPAALNQMAAFFVRQGVTSYLPTTISQSPQAVQAAIENLRLSLAGDGVQALEAQPLGIHLEGPYLSPSHHGAQPVEWLRNPDPAEYRRWFDTGIIRLVTLAPELPGALDCIRSGAALGVRFSVGHTASSYDQVEQAAEAGLTQATHTFNGMPALHHREPGPVGAVLVDDRIFAEVIADGVHLHPAVLKMVIRIKGIERTLLVTDAIRAAGLADGEYVLGSQTVSVHEGVARTQSGSLAGSTLTLNRAVYNAMCFAGLTLNQAITMATTTPAAALGLSAYKGALKPGADADVILIDQDLKVHAAFVQGKLVYQS